MSTTRRSRIHVGAEVLTDGERIPWLGHRHGVVKEIHSIERHHMIVRVELDDGQSLWLDRDHVRLIGGDE